MDNDSRPEGKGLRFDFGVEDVPNAFTILYEKALSHQVVLGCWCPTMDLLALVSDDGQLGVHRLEWQKLWVACPDAPITSLCWRPDGKVLAAGHRHGAVSLYNVEACELFRTLRAPQTAPICHLSWVQGIPPNPATATPTIHLAYRYRHTRFFQGPPQAASGDRNGGRGGGPSGASAANGAKRSDAGSGGAGPFGTAQDWPAPPDSLDVLVASDASGGISMMACGEVLVAALPPRAVEASAAGSAKELQASRTAASSTGTAAAADGAMARCGPAGEVPGALQAMLSRDLATLVVMSEPASAPASEAAAGAAAGSCGPDCLASSWFSVYSCGKLGSCQEEILELSLLGSVVVGKLEAAQAALGLAARAWRAATVELTKRFDEQLRETMESHGHDPDDLVGELTCMLASGHVSPPLQAFLANTLTEPGLRRLAKTVDQALQDVSGQLLDAVIPALQLVAFVVGELRGRAKMAEITQTLGLHERSVAVAEVEAVKALIQAEVLRQLITRVACQYRVFFTWLLKTLQRLEEARGGDAEDSPLPGASSNSLAGVAVDVPTLLAFLQECGQFTADAVARDLDASQSTLGLPVGSLRYPAHLLQHLKALQQTVFPWPAAAPDRDQAAQGHAQALQQLLLEVRQQQSGEQRTPPGQEVAAANWAGGERGVSVSVGGVCGSLGVEALSRGSGGGSSGIAGWPGAGGGGGGAGTGGGGGSSWPDRPLQRQLATLAELCRTTFGRLEKDVSPTVQLIARYPLLPPASPGYEPQLDSGWASCLQLPQIRTEPCAGEPALLACVISAAASGEAPGAPAVLRAWVSPRPDSPAAGATSATTAASLGCSGSEAVLLVRAPLAGATERRHRQPQAGLLWLPPGLRVIGLSYYRSAQLALLLVPAVGDPGIGPQSGHGAGSAGLAGRPQGNKGAVSGSSSAADPRRPTGLLALVPTEGLHMCDVGSGAAAVSPTSMAQVCAERGAVSRWPVPGCRLRRPPPGNGAGWLAPLLMSAPRGLAAVCLEGCRAWMVDLEEDEEGAEAEEREEDEEVAGGRAGAGRGSDDEEDQEDRMEEDG